MKRTGARPQDDDDADKTDRGREPAAQADLLAEEKIDSAVTNSGETSRWRRLSAIGRNRRPEMKNSDEAEQRRTTQQLQAGPLCLQREQWRARQHRRRHDQRKVRNSIQVISIDGKVADRYFAVTSEVPRKIVDARISAMPLNGRSARAGTRGRWISSRQRQWDAVQPGVCGGRCQGNLEKAAIMESGEALKTPFTGEQQGPKTDSDMRARARRPVAVVAVAIAILCWRTVSATASASRGFGPRGKALSSAASSLSLNRSPPAAALSAAWAALGGFGNRKHRGPARQKVPSAT